VRTVLKYEPEVEGDPIPNDRLQYEEDTPHLHLFAEHLAKHHLDAVEEKKGVLIAQGEGDGENQHPILQKKNWEVEKKHQ
jgi:hypothetical protein